MASFKNYATNKQNNEQPQQTQQGTQQSSASPVATTQKFSGSSGATFLSNAKKNGKTSSSSTATSSSSSSSSSKKKDFMSEEEFNKRYLEEINKGTSHEEAINKIVKDYSEEALKSVTDNNDPSSLYGKSKIANAATRLGHAGVGLAESFVGSMAEGIVDTSKTIAHAATESSIGGLNSERALSTPEQNLLLAVKGTNNSDYYPSWRELNADTQKYISSGRFMGIKSEADYEAAMDVIRQKKAAQEPAREAIDNAYNDFWNNTTTGSAIRKMEDLGQQRIYESTYGMKDGLAKNVMEVIPSLGQMVLDARVSGPSKALAVMVNRVFGQSYYDAEKNGATSGQAAKSAFTAAAIEYISEIIGGESILDTALYGMKGKTFSSAVDKIISKLPNKVLKTVAIAVSDGISEGNEEVMSELLSPLSEAFLQDGDLRDAVAELYKEKFGDTKQLTDDVWNSFVGGFISGLFGVTGDIAFNGGAETKNRIGETNTDAKTVKAYGDDRSAALKHDIENTINVLGNDEAKSKAWNDAYNTQAQKLSSVTDGSILYDGEGNPVGEVKATFSDGYVIDYYDGTSETVIRTRDGFGGIAPDSKALSYLKYGEFGFSEIGEENAFNASQDARFEGMQDDMASADEAQQNASSQTTEEAKNNTETFTPERNEAPKQERKKPTNYTEAIKQVNEDNKRAYADLVKRYNAGGLNKEEFDILKKALDEKYRAAVEEANKAFPRNEEADASDRFDSIIEQANNGEYDDVQENATETTVGEPVENTHINTGENTQDATQGVKRGQNEEQNKFNDKDAKRAIELVKAWEKNEIKGAQNLADYIDNLTKEQAEKLQGLFKGSNNESIKTLYNLISAKLYNGEIYNQRNATTNKVSGNKLLNAIRTKAEKNASKSVDSVDLNNLAKKRIRATLDSIKSKAESNSAKTEDNVDIKKMVPKRVSGAKLFDEFSKKAMANESDVVGINESSNILDTIENRARIESFTGDYAFLSNSGNSPIKINSRTFKSVNDALSDPSISKEFSLESIVRRKFQQNTDLREKLFSTGNAILNDGTGLGKTLMKIRSELSAADSPYNGKMEHLEAAKGGFKSELNYLLEQRDKKNARHKALLSKFGGISNGKAKNDVQKQVRDGHVGDTGYGRPELQRETEETIKSLPEWARGDGLEGKFSRKYERSERSLDGTSIFRSLRGKIVRKGDFVYGAGGYEVIKPALGTVEHYAYNIAQKFGLKLTIGGGDMPFFPSGNVKAEIFGGAIGNEIAVYTDGTTKCIKTVMHESTHGSISKIIEDTTENLQRRAEFIYDAVNSSCKKAGIDPRYADTVAKAYMLLGYEEQYNSDGTTESLNKIFKKTKAQKTVKDALTQRAYEEIAADIISGADNFIAINSNVSDMKYMFGETLSNEQILKLKDSIISEFESKGVFTKEEASALREAGNAIQEKDFIRPEGFTFENGKPQTSKKVNKITLTLAQRNISKFESGISKHLDSDGNVKRYSLNELRSMPPKDRIDVLKAWGRKYNAGVTSKGQREQTFIGRLLAKVTNTLDVNNELEKLRDNRSFETEDGNKTSAIDMASTNSINDEGDVVDATSSSSLYNENNIYNADDRENVTTVHDFLKTLGANSEESKNKTVNQLLEDYFEKNKDSGKYNANIGVDEFTQKILDFIESSTKLPAKFKDLGNASAYDVFNQVGKNVTDTESNTDNKIHPLDAKAIMDVFRSLDRETLNKLVGGKDANGKSSSFSNAVDEDLEYLKSRLQEQSGIDSAGYSAKYSDKIIEEYLDGVDVDDDDVASRIAKEAVARFEEWLNTQNETSEFDGEYNSYEDSHSKNTFRPTGMGNTTYEEARPKTTLDFTSADNLSEEAKAKAAKYGIKPIVYGKGENKVTLYAMKGNNPVQAVPDGAPKALQDIVDNHKKRLEEINKKAEAASDNPVLYNQYRKEYWREQKFIDKLTKGYGENAYTVRDLFNDKYSLLTAEEKATLSMLSTSEENMTVAGVLHGMDRSEGIKFAQELYRNKEANKNGETNGRRKATENGVRGEEIRDNSDRTGYWTEGYGAKNGEISKTTGRENEILRSAEGRENGLGIRGADGENGESRTSGLSKEELKKIQQQDRDIIKYTLNKYENVEDAIKYLKDEFEINEFENLYEDEIEYVFHTRAKEISSIENIPATERIKKKSSERTDLKFTLCDTFTLVRKVDGKYKTFVVGGIKIGGGNARIYGRDIQILNHESAHDDYLCAKSNIERSNAYDWNFSFEEHVKDEIDASLKECGVNPSDAIDFLKEIGYEEDEIGIEGMYEELYCEFSSVMFDGEKTDWGNDKIDFNEIAEKLRGNKRFNDLINFIQKNADERTKTLSMEPLKAGDKRKIDPSQPGTERDFWADKSAPEYTKQANDAGKKLFRSFSPFDSSKSKASDTLKTAYNTIRDNFAKMSVGKITPAEFADSMRKEVSKNSELGIYWSEDFQKEFDELADYYEKAKNADETQDFSVSYRRRAARLMMSYAQYVEDVNKISTRTTAKLVADIEKNANKNVNKNGAIRLAAQWLDRMQISASNVFKGKIGGFNAKSEGYKIAEEYEKTISNRISTEVKAKSFFAGIKDTPSMQKILSGETMSGVKFTEASGNEVELTTGEMMDAILNLRTLAATTKGQLDWDRLYETRGIALKNRDGEITRWLEFEGKNKQERAAWAKKKLAEMEKAISKDTEAKAFYDATVDMLYEMGQKTNSTFERLHGYSRSMFSKGNYHTLRVIGKNSSKTQINEVMFGGVQDYNAMKDRGDRNGYVVVQPLNAYVDSYIQQASNYVAFAEFGRKLQIMNNSNSVNGGIGKALGNAQGKTWEDWMTNFVNDMNIIKEKDSSEMTGLNRPLKSMRMAMTQGTLLGSPATAIKQISSRFNAMGLLDPRAVNMAWRASSKETEALRNKNLLYKSRAMGNTDADVSDALNSGWVKKLSDKSKVFKTWANLTNIADQWAVSRVYNACVYDTQLNYPGLDVNSDVFKARVDSKFEEVLLKSQPIFTKQARAEYHRTDNEIIRMVSMFRTQQTQNYNRMVEAIGEYGAALKSGENVKDAKKKLTDTIRGQATAVAEFSMLSIIADLLLHKTKKYEDDEGDELDLDKIATRFGLNALETATATTWFADQAVKWVIDEIDGNDYNGKEFYGISLGAISTMKNVANAIVYAFKSPNPYTIKTALSYAAQLGGIPVNNVYNIANSIVMYAEDITGQNLGNYDDMLKQAGDYGNNLYRAVRTGNDAKAERNLEAMGNKYRTTIKDASYQQLKDGASGAEIRDILFNYAEMTEAEIDSWMKDAKGRIDTGFKDTDDVKKNFTEGKIKPSEAMDYLVSYQGKSTEDAQKKLAEWQFAVDFAGRGTNKTDWTYNNLYNGNYYMHGKISEDEAVDYLMRYGSMTQEKAEARVKSWSYEKDTGVDFESLSDGYINKGYTDKQVVDARMEMAGDTKEEATLYLHQLQFKKEYGKSYTNLKQMWRDKEISDKDAKYWYEQVYGSDGSNWLEKQQFWRDTGYEASTTYNSTFNDHYATKEHMGAKTFYDNYGTQFKGKGTFAEVMMAIDNRYDVGADETKYVYNQSKGWGASKGQAGAIELLNKYISQGKISYETAKLIWTQYCGWSAKSSNAWQYVHK